MLSNYVKTTLRNLARNKGYSFLNVFGLAIGIACAGLIFLWAENELKWDSSYANKSRIYAIRENASYDGNTFTNWSTPRPMAAAVKAEIPGVVNVCRMSDESQNLLFTIGGRSLYSAGKYADPSVFSMFTLAFAEGGAATAFSQLHSVVITESAAKKFFGDDKTVIGKTVRVDNKQNYIVTGVLKDLPENSTLKFEWLIPYEVNLIENNSYASGDASDWASYGPFTFVELNSAADAGTINKQLYNYIHSKNAGQTTHAFLFPMRDWHLYDEFVNGKQTGGGQIAQVRLLSLIAWIILLIACINFMNLATASSEKRAKEVGVRKVLGSGKRALVFQFFGEAMMMSLLAALCAVIIIRISLPAFNMLMQKRLALDPGNPVHIIFLFSITLICGLIAGSYPSFYLSSFNAIQVLKGSRLKTGSAALIRKGLVVIQFAVSVVFIISTVVVYLQIQHIKSRDLGFNKNNLIEIDPQHDIAKTFTLIKQELLHTGLIENAAMADHSTLYGGNTDDGFRWKDKPENSQVSIAHRNVSPDFISTSRMQIIDGRDFSSDTASEKSNVIINQSLAKLMGKGSAVGKIIQSPRGNRDGEFTNVRVIGVVKDYIYGNIYDGGAAPLIIFCKPAEYQNFIYARLKPVGNIGQALSTIAAVMKKANPAYPIEYRFVDDQFNQMYQDETLTSKVSGVFAMLAIIISCLGLFGLATYTAERRIKEIGIRKVLGASVAGITTLLSKDFLKLVAIACLIAYPLAWWIMHNWLQHYEYRIEISWWIFMIAGLASMMIALITISFQSIRAAIANPVKSLRTE